MDQRLLSEEMAIASNPATNTSVPNPAFPILIVICGPTATGKTGLALNLAHELNGVILSADSRQVYREFDIGTAKPTPTEQKSVPHYLIDICDPTESLTVADYQTQAQTLMATFHEPLRSREAKDQENKRVEDTDSSLILHSSSSIPLSCFPHPSSLIPHPSSVPLLVGGTGLYIKSIVRGLKIPRVAPQPELRSQFQSLGQAQCYGFLKQVDPVAAEKIHPHDAVRTMRALEVFYVSGQPISKQQGESPPSYPILQIGLDCFDPEDCQRDRLLERIAKRTQQMIAAGLVEEVETLCHKYGPDLPLLNTLGYQEIKHHLAGKITLEQAQEFIILHTRQFAKRQRTWFRTDSTIAWFDADSFNLLDQVKERVQQFISCK
jgi:tRNA dimethylallyltransferase